MIQTDNPTAAEFDEWFQARCAINPALKNSEALLRETFMAGATSVQAPAIIQPPQLTAIGSITISHTDSAAIVDRNFDADLSRVANGHYAVYIVAAGPRCDYEELLSGMPQPSCTHTQDDLVYNETQLLDYGWFVFNAVQERKSVGWRGFHKVIEEMGEKLQILGKLGAYPDGNHPDGKGPLMDRLVEEFGDERGATDYFIRTNGLDANAIEERSQSKQRRFEGWHMSGILQHPD